MNLTGFDDQQKQTLLDLLVIGMYANGHLADAEDAKIEGVLDTMSFASLTEREQFIDASFTRTRKHLDSPQAMRDFVVDIAKHFPTPDLRRKAYDDLEDLLAGEKTNDNENRFLTIVKEEFKL